MPNQRSPGRALLRTVQAADHGADIKGIDQLQGLPERFKQRYRLAFAALPLPLMVLAVAVAVLIAYQFITADMQPFIYFQF